MNRAEPCKDGVQNFLFKHLARYNFFHVGSCFHLDGARQMYISLSGGLFLK